VQILSKVSSSGCEELNIDGGSAATSTIVSGNSKWKGVAGLWSIAKDDIEYRWKTSSIRNSLYGLVRVVLDNLCYINLNFKFNFRISGKLWITSSDTIISQVNLSDGSDRWGKVRGLSIASWQSLFNLMTTSSYTDYPSDDQRPAQNLIEASSHNDYHYIDDTLVADKSQNNPALRVLSDPASLIHDPWSFSDAPKRLRVPTKNDPYRLDGLGPRCLKRLEIKDEKSKLQSSIYLQFFNLMNDTELRNKVDYFSGPPFSVVSSCCAADLRGVILIQSRWERRSKPS